MTVPDEDVLTDAVDWIAARILEGRVVLIHCAKGRGRSATVLAAYLMDAEGMTFDEVDDLLNDEAAAGQAAGQAPQGARLVDRATSGTDTRRRSRQPVADGRMTEQGGVPWRGRGLARAAVLLVMIALVLGTVCGAQAARLTSPSPSPASGDPAPATISPATSAGPSASTETGAAAVTMIAAGDIGRCDSTADDATGALAASLPGVVATLGDTAYEDGTTQQLEECFGGSWGGVKDRIRFAVTGNHDIHTDGGEPLRAYMGSAAARDGRTWFSDDLGAWHVVVLDSNCGFLGDLCGSESDQVRWLREDLAASGARCTIALMHQPRFSSGQHGDSQAVGSFWDELYAANAEVVLAGHDHDYERFAPQAPDGTAGRCARLGADRRWHWWRRSGGVQGGSAELPGPDQRRARGPRAHAWRRIRGRPASSISLAWHATRAAGAATDQGSRQAPVHRS